MWIYGKKDLIGENDSWVKISKKRISVIGKKYKYSRWKNKEYRKEISQWKYNVSWIVKIKLDGH